MTQERHLSTNTVMRRLFLVLAVSAIVVEALRVFAGCRKLFSAELGADPLEQTMATFLKSCARERKASISRARAWAPADRGPEVPTSLAVPHYQAENSRFRSQVALRAPGA